MKRIEPMPADLLAAIAIAALTTIFILIPMFTNNLLIHMLVGLFMVLFLPGYTVVAALFPKKDDLDGIERVALSFGLSIAVVPLIGVGLNFTPWGIRLAPVAASLALFVTAFAILAYLRRIRLSPEARFAVGFKRSMIALRARLIKEKMSKGDKMLTIILVLSIIGSAFAILHLVMSPRPGEKYTEFYILGAGGRLSDYPASVAAGDNCSVTVGIINHEYSTANYTLRLLSDNITLLDGMVRLDHDQTWQNQVSFVLRRPGDGQKVEFLLYKEENFTSPYRELDLWINVSP